jgi:hypothetical protein
MAYRTLKLTSPHMRGEDVGRLQRKLGVKVDGDFGDDTGAAVARWKKYAGYPVDEIDMLIGARGQRLLYGEQKLPDDYRERAIARRAAAQAAKAKRSHRELSTDLLVAMARRGVGERPAGSNKVPELIGLANKNGVRDMPNMGAAWCEFAVNVTSLEYGGRYARFALVDRKTNGWYTVTAVGNAQRRVLCEIVPFHLAQYGDRVYFNFGGRDLVQHVGRFLRWEGSTVRSVDGNTSVNGSQDNGGEVQVRVRSRSTVRYIVRDL